MSTVDNLQETATERFFIDVNCVFKALLPQSVLYKKLAASYAHFEKVTPFNVSFEWNCYP
ncbi:hypothetical protein HQ998_002854 [Salmonella enterica]|nr:hypothetical protein [Salmonella enterica]EFV4097277.1 hypothetical protein [Salmonella enterica]EIH3660548.1 hypothetical protein [Salmonella enterica]